MQGDYLSKDVEFPAPAHHGDLVVIHDTGAYGMTMYSKFNSILPSAVYGFRKEEEGESQVKIFCFKERETPEENLRFWGRKKPR